MSTRPWNEISPSMVPCQCGDADLWFADNPVDVERAKTLCTDCPIRRECLAAALARHEPCGVWGGEIIERGTVVARKPARGRPPKNVERSRHLRAVGSLPAAASAPSSGMTAR